MLQSDDVREASTAQLFERRKEQRQDQPSFGARLTPCRDGRTRTRKAPQSNGILIFILVVFHSPLHRTSTTPTNRMDKSDIDDSTAAVPHPYPIDKLSTNMNAARMGNVSACDLNNTNDSLEERGGRPIVQVQVTSCI